MGWPQNGQLTYQQFQQGLQLFTQWWQSAVGSTNEASCWRMNAVTLPVVEQVVNYAELERVLSPAVPAAVTATGVMQQAPNTASAVAVEDSPPASGSATAATRSHEQLAAVTPAPCTACTATTEVAGSDEGVCELVDSDDACVTCSGLFDSTVPQAATAVRQQQVHLHQYSIVWHDTYQVPVLYIRAMRPDGMCLGLGELMQDLPGLQNSKEPGQADWTYITAVEHPLLRSPWFMLHPCQTADRMNLMMQELKQVTSVDSAADLTSSDGNISSTQRPDVAAKLMPAVAESTATPGATELLHYMKCWFSLVADVIGFSMIMLDSPQMA